MEYIPQEEDGIMAVINSPDAFMFTALGLHAMQHRGKDYHSICCGDGITVHQSKHTGLVQGRITLGSPLIPGNIALGQVRFSREQRPNILTLSPFVMTCRKGTMALAMSGSVEVEEFRAQLERIDVVFQGGSEAEVIMQLIAKAPSDTFVDSVFSVVRNLSGAFCIVLITPTSMIVARDQFGFRPFTMGTIVNEDKSISYVFASETCALDIVGAKYEGEVKPGEVVEIQLGKKPEHHPFASSRILHHCSREHTILSRPDSKAFGRYIALSHEQIGKTLADEHSPCADIVTGIPDHGTVMALAYDGGQPKPLYKPVLLRNHYCASRNGTFRITANKNLLQYKSVTVVTNQILSGNSTREITKKLRDAGASRINLLIGSPPTTAFCCWGVDIPKQETLLAHRHNSNIAAMQKELLVDYLGFISLEGFLKALGNGDRFCTSCFTGNYPKGLLQLP